MLVLSETGLREDKGYKILPLRRAPSHPRYNPEGEVDLCNRIRIKNLLYVLTKAEPPETDTE